MHKSDVKISKEFINITVTTLDLVFEQSAENIKNINSLRPSDAYMRR